MTPEVAREKVELEFASEKDAVDEYMNTFGPFVTARTMLEPQGRWPEFVQAFADLIRRFNLATDGTAKIQGEYLLITVDLKRPASSRAPRPQQLERRRPSSREGGKGPICGPFRE